MKLSEAKGKVPGEALADLLQRIAGHARKYKVTGMSFHLKEESYRVSVEGEGELVLPGDKS